jgi:hypothetical protein
MGLSSAGEADARSTPAGARPGFLGAAPHFRVNFFAPRPGTPRPCVAPCCSTAPVLSSLHTSCADLPPPRPTPPPSAPLAAPMCRARGGGGSLKGIGPSAYFARAAGSGRFLEKSACRAGLTALSDTSRARWPLAPAREPCLLGECQPLLGECKEGSHSPGLYGLCVPRRRCSNIEDAFVECFLAGLSPHWGKRAVQRVCNINVLFKNGKLSWLHFWSDTQDIYDKFQLCWCD